MLTIVILTWNTVNENLVRGALYLFRCLFRIGICFLIKTWLQYKNVQEFIFLLLFIIMSINLWEASPTLKSMKSKDRIKENPEFFQQFMTGSNIIYKKVHIFIYAKKKDTSLDKHIHVLWLSCVRAKMTCLIENLLPACIINGEVRPS